MNHLVYKMLQNSEKNDYPPTVQSSLFKLKMSKENQQSLTFEKLELEKKRFHLCLKNDCNDK